MLFRILICNLADVDFLSGSEGTLGAQYSATIHQDERDIVVLSVFFRSLNKTTSVLSLKKNYSVSHHQADMSQSLCVSFQLGLVSSSGIGAISSLEFVVS